MKRALVSGAFPGDSGPYIMTGHRSNPLLSWSLILKKDFSGWPVRSSQKYGKGYITKGKKGLFLEGMNGEKVTMSVLDGEKALEALAAYGARPQIA